MSIHADIRQTDWGTDLPQRLRARLQPEAMESIRSFVRQQQHADGGFQGRDGSSDLYYTVFGIECLLWLQANAPLESTRRYLQQTRTRLAQLDFVHQASLGRCLRRLSDSPEMRTALNETITSLKSRFRAGEGFHQKDGSTEISIYDTFLAAMAGGETILAPLHAESIRRQMREDGSFPGHPEDATGTLPSTVAAWMLLLQKEAAIPDTSIAFVNRCEDPQGGWRAVPHAPTADLLSTATALHARTAAGMPLDHTEACEDFIIDQWQYDGGFRGYPNDTTSDVEYTFYGLLSLACLADKP